MSNIDEENYEENIEYSILDKRFEVLQKIKELEIIFFKLLDDEYKNITNSINTEEEFIKVTSSELEQLKIIIGKYLKEKNDL